MRKIVLFILVISMVATLSFAGKVGDMVKQSIEGKNPAVSVEIKAEKDCKELPGYKYIQLVINPGGKTLFVLTNGKYVIPAFIDINTGVNLVEKVKMETVKIDFKPDDKHFYFGNPNAKVKIIVFSDFECPFCKRASEFLKPILKENKDKVAVYYYHFPLSFHKHALLLARIYEALKELGVKMDLYSDIALKKGMTEEDLINQVAQKLPKDKQAQFKKLVKSDKYDLIIADDQQKGRALGVKGTPYIIIDGAPVEGYRPGVLKGLILQAIDKYYKAG